MMEATRTHCDSPKIRAATDGGRVIGEISTVRPADLSRERRSLPLLPACSPGQRAVHPRSEAFDKPHAHKTACGHGTARCTEYDCRKARCATCLPVAERRAGERVAHLAGRADPMTILPFGGKVKPLNPNRKPKNGKRARLRASA